MAKRASVINFKGGVGKTTLALHLGCYLTKFHKPGCKVLMVDVDHQSSLSIVMMGPKAWEARCLTGDTVNRVFASYTTQGAQMPADEVIVSQPLGAKYPTLDLVPGQLELDDTEIDLAATTIGSAILSEWAKRTLLAKWLDQDGIDDEYDYVIFDCPPATKIVSQNAIAASHAYIIPVIPDAISTRGVTHFKNLVSNRIDTKMKAFAAGVSAAQTPSTYVPDTSLGGIVISGAQRAGSKSGYTNDHTTQMHALRARLKGEVLKPIIRRATGVSESLGAGRPVFDATDNVNVTGQKLPEMFKTVCADLVTRMGW